MIDARAKLELYVGDITTLAVDAIVNAANPTLLGGGGVDGAIHWAAGMRLRMECLMLGGCRTGDAKLTSGYKLPARHVIHTVGPVWKDGAHGEPYLLRNCYRRCFALAKEHGIRSIAFPAISCGVYGYPFKAACLIAAEEALSAVLARPDLDRVIFVAYGPEIETAYREALATIAGG